MNDKKVNKRSDEYKSVFGNAPKRSTGNGGSADWSTATPELLLKLLDAVTSRGGAIRFGYTRDGGAYAVGFYYADEKRTEYVRPSDGIDQFLEEWIEFYLNKPNTNGRSPVAQ